MRTLAALVAAVLSFGAAFAGVRAVRAAPDPVIEAGSGSEMFRPNEVVTDLVGVYIGSSSCSWCQDPSLPAAVARIQSSLRLKGKELHARVVLIGIDLDPVPSRELGHLRRIGRFHQISLGGGPLGEAVRPFFWDRMAGFSVTPQFVVFARRQRRVDGGSGPLGIEGLGDELLTRKLGLQDLTRWAHGGAPIPEPRGERNAQ